MSAVVCFATLKLNIFIILINIFLISPFETTSHFPETSIIQQISNESNSSSSAISDPNSAEDSFAVTWTNRIRQKEIQRHQINQNIMRHLKLSAKPNITAPIKLSDADMVALNKKPVHCPRKQKQMKSADVFCYILLSACHMGNTNNNNNNHKNDLNFEFILPQFLNEDKDYLTNIQHAKLFLKKYRRRLRKSYRHPLKVKLTATNLKKGVVEIENKLKRGLSNQWHMMNIKKLMQSWKRDKVHVLKMSVSVDYSPSSSSSSSSSSPSLSPSLLSSSSAHLLTKFRIKSNEIFTDTCSTEELDPKLLKQLGTPHIEVVLVRRVHSQKHPRQQLQQLRVGNATTPTSK